MGRMDRGWQVRSEARVNIQHPPSYYQSKIYYDCITMSERALRFLIDTVGIERVMLGSDFCFGMGYDQPVEVVTGHPALDDFFAVLCVQRCRRKND